LSLKKSLSFLTSLSAGFSCLGTYFSLGLLENVLENFEKIDTFVLRKFDRIFVAYFWLDFANFIFIGSVDVVFIFY
jgi:hypothetical protein